MKWVLFTVIYLGVLGLIYLALKLVFKKRWLAVTYMGMGTIFIVLYTAYSVAWLLWLAGIVDGLHWYGFIIGPFGISIGWKWLHDGRKAWRKLT